jgi:drug/metabolite transporter (DMT)-like permease
MKNFLLWLLLATIWGSAFASIKIGVESISPIALVTGRMILAAIIMLSYLYISGKNLSRSPKIWLSYFIAGMLSNICPYLLISYGEQHVDSGLAAIFMGMTPVAVVLFAPLVIAGERYTVTSFLGIILGLIGLIILVGLDTLNQFGIDLINQLYIICAAVFYAAGTIYVRKFVTRPALEMATGSILTGAIFIFIIGWLQGDFTSMPMPSKSSLMAMIYLGLIPTGFAAILYFYLVKAIEVSSLSMINFVVPIIGAILGITLFGETLKPSTWIALCFISAAVYLVNIKSKKITVEH